MDIAGKRLRLQIRVGKEGREKEAGQSTFYLYVYARNQFSQVRADIL